jgi:hypothetical protein
VKGRDVEESAESRRQIQNHDRILVIVERLAAKDRQEEKPAVW